MTTGCARGDGFGGAPRTASPYPGPVRPSWFLWEGPLCLFQYDDDPEPEAILTAPPGHHGGGFRSGRRPGAPNDRHRCPERLKGIAP